MTGGSVGIVDEGSRQRIGSRLAQRAARVVRLDTQCDIVPLEIIADESAEAGGARVSLRQRRPVRYVVLKHTVAHCKADKRARAGAEIHAGDRAASLPAGIEAAPAGVGRRRRYPR